MKKKFYSLLLVFLTLMLTAGCSALGITNAAPRTINVVGRGEVYVVPDIAYVYIGVRSQADAVSDALNQNNAQAQQVAQTLQGFGVAPEDIQTTAFNVYPQQEYGPDGQLARTYYVVENTVFVKVRAMQSLGELLDQVVQNGANNITGVSFDVVDREAVSADARQQAVADARAKAEEIATAAGVELGDLQTVIAYASSVPQPLYQPGGMAANQMGAPMAAGQLVISAEANVVYEIE